MPIFIDFKEDILSSFITLRNSFFFYGFSIEKKEFNNFYNFFERLVNNFPEGFAFADFFRFNDEAWLRLKQRNQAFLNNYSDSYPFLFFKSVFSEKNIQDVFMKNKIFVKNLINNHKNYVQNKILVLPIDLGLLSLKKSQFIINTILTQKFHQISKESKLINLVIIDDDINIVSFKDILINAFEHYSNKFEGTIKVFSQKGPPLLKSQKYKDEINTKEKRDIICQISQLKYGSKAELLKKEMMYRLGSYDKFLKDEDFSLYESEQFDKLDDFRIQKKPATNRVDGVD